MDLENFFYVGNALGVLLYGVQLTLCFQSIYFLSTKSLYSKNQRLFYTSFTAAITVAVGIEQAARLFTGQSMWITHRNGPGGPLEYLSETVDAWYINTGTASGTFGLVIGDCLLLFRCFIITGSRLWIILAPAAILLTYASLAIVSIVETASTANDFLRLGNVRAGTLWICLAVLFNVMVTAIISLKIITAYTRIKATISRKHAALYLGVVAILVESALPYALFAIAFAVAYALDSASSMALANIWVLSAGIGPQLIILRVAMGIAWSKDTLPNAPLSELMFEQNQTRDHSRHNDVDTAV